MPESPRAQDDAKSRGGTSGRWRWVGLIAGAALVTHLHVLWGGWVRDDYALIISNSAIRSLQSIPGQLQSPFLGIFWRPSVTISYTLEYALWGLRPAGFHATNLALFTLASVLVYRLWLAFAHQPLAAGFAGVLYAVHGAHYQPAVIADRTGLLCTTGCLVAWLASLRAIKSPHLYRRFLWAVFGIGAYTVALGAKEEAVTLPVLMLLVAALSSASWSDVRRMLPVVGIFLAMACAYILLRGHILGGDGILTVIGPGLSERVFTLPLWLLHHWTTVIFPWHLDIDYRGLVWPHTDTARVVIAWLVVSAAVIGAWYVRGRHRVVILGLGIGLVAWLPTSNLVPVYPETAAHHVFMPPHFLLYPNIGYSGVLGAAIAGVVVRWRALGLALACLYFGFQGATTVYMNHLWSDDLRLYRYVTKMHPRHPMMLRNLGLALSNRGEHAEAAEAFRRSIAASPSPEAYNGLGLALRNSGNSEGALQAFAYALEVDPAHTHARVNGADLMRRLNRVDDALKLLEAGQGVADDPGAVADMWAIILRDVGRLADAHRILELFLATSPSDARLWNTMGTVLVEMGDATAGRDAWLRAEELAPGMTPAASNLRALEGRTR